MITVRQLREFLDQFPDDMGVIETRCSDYREMTLEHWTIVKAVIKVSGDKGWIMQANDYRMNPEYENKRFYLGPPPDEIKEFLHFKGN